MSTDDDARRDEEPNKGWFFSSVKAISSIFASMARITNDTAHTDVVDARRDDAEEKNKNADSRKVDERPCGVGDLFGQAGQGRASTAEHGDMGELGEMFSKLSLSYWKSTDRDWANGWKEFAMSVKKRTDIGIPEHHHKKSAYNACQLLTEAEEKQWNWILVQVIKEGANQADRSDVLRSARMAMSLERLRSSEVYDVWGAYRQRGQEMPKAIVDSFIKADIAKTKAMDILKSKYTVGISSINEALDEEENKDKQGQAPPASYKRDRRQNEKKFQEEVVKKRWREIGRGRRLKAIAASAVVVAAVAAVVPPPARRADDGAARQNDAEPVPPPVASDKGNGDAALAVPPTARPADDGAAELELESAMLVEEAEEGFNGAFGGGAVKKPAANKPAAKKRKRDGVSADESEKPPAKKPAAKKASSQKRDAKAAPKPDCHERPAASVAAPVKAPVHSAEHTVSGASGKARKSLGPKARASVVTKRGVTTKKRGITKASIRKIARRGGCKRLASSVYDEARTILRAFVDNLMSDTAPVMKLVARKTVCVADVMYALKKQGRTLYAIP